MESRRGFFQRLRQVAMGGMVAAVAGPSLIEVINKGTRPGWDGNIRPTLAEIDKAYNDAWAGGPPMIGGAYSKGDSFAVGRPETIYHVPNPRNHARIYGIGVPK